MSEQGEWSYLKVECTSLMGEQGEWSSLKGEQGE
jgi:hypothetical protein